MTATNSVPVTILTGFLGAGKTTLVNHILHDSHGLRLAVAVNEFGQVGIDASLIVGAAGPVVELANGCICCATQGDLHRALESLLTTGGEIDGVLIETSGLADPAPIIDSLETWSFPRDLRLDGVITVLDAVNFDDNLDRAEAAFQQIVLGDLLLVNKVDLVAADVPERIEHGVRQLNPLARVVPCVSCRVPMEIVFGIQRVEPTAHKAGGDHVHDGFESVVLTTAHPLNPEHLDNWLSGLPSSIYRVKGFVRFAGRAGSMVVHMVGSRRSAEAAPAAAETMGATLVVIGRALSPAQLQDGLHACVASP
jgi:G3E family GTPase